MFTIGYTRGFSIEILTEVTLSWKTESNRSISAMEDRVPGWLQHCHKTCCKKDGHHGRQACIIDVEKTVSLWECIVKIIDGGLHFLFFIFSFHFILFLFFLFLLFSIFRIIYKL